MVHATRALREEQQPGDREAGDRLVQKRGVERRELLVGERPVREVDLEAPRERRGPTEQLLVEVIAPPADSLREHDADGETVHDHDRVEVAATCDHDHRDEPETDRTPDRQTAAPDLEGTPRVVLEPLVVGDHVVEPRADHAPHDHPERDVVDRAGGYPRLRQRRSDTQMATSTPTASRMPYM